MHSNHSAGPRRHPPGDLLGRDVEGSTIDVGEDRRGAAIEHRVGGRDPRKGRHDDLVTWTDLQRRKGELEGQLIRARGTDFANPKTDVVSVGTRVRVTELNTEHSELFTILGASDSDPEKGIISYLTPIAQSLLNHKEGEEVEFELGGAKKHFRIDSIEAYKTTETPTA